MNAPVFSIFGGGLAGPLLATLLGRRGHAVHLYEMRPDPRRMGYAGGRSINLALSLRGLHALQAIGLDDAVRALALPMRGRMMHAVSGALTFQPYGTEEGQHLNSISRGGLNVALLEAAAACPGVTLHFEQKLEDLEIESSMAEIRDLASGATRKVPAGIAIGTDGAHSRVRAAMERQTGMSCTQDYLDYGYKELTMPAATGGGFAMAPDALHIWPRRAFMLIALPNLDRTYTCTLFLPMEGPGSFETLKAPGAASAFFREWFPDVVPLLPALPEEFAANPTGSLVTVRCRPWRHEGRVVLVGDASHAVVPFYGQGMNAAFESCVVLDECMARAGSDWGRAFAEYEALRKPNTDALADLALENFVEMRDRVASRSFLVKRQLGRGLHRLFPRWYVPLYTMVTFTRMPYSEARNRARLQERTVAVVLAVLAVALVAVLFVLI